jgi:hypothetical protein
MSGELHPRWMPVGTEYTDGRGYVFVKVKPGHPMRHKQQAQALKHRLVMAEHIGRMLNPEEHVHHVNNDKGDNLIENLWLFPDNASHVLWHKMLKGYKQLYAMPPVRLGRQNGARR